jgi:hypothetical protein
MTMLAPIDSRSFSFDRRADASPAACRLAPLIRLMALAALGGLLISVAAGPGNAGGREAAPGGSAMALASH